MFGSSMLDIAVGVVFIFLLLSIFGTAINEVILSLLSMRGKYLLSGIATLLNEDLKSLNDEGLVSKIYNHGQVFGLYEKDFKPSKPGNLPSYIPSRNFAIAFLDSIAQPFSQMPAPVPTDPTQPAATTPAAIVQQVMTITADFKAKASELKVTNPKVGVPLLSMITMAGDDAQKLQKSVQDWFDSGMDRVSGRYKYRTQIVLFWIGLGIAIAMNADTIHIVRQLSNDSTLRQSLVAAAATAKPPAAAGQKAGNTSDVTSAVAPLIRESDAQVMPIDGGALRVALQQPSDQTSSDATIKTRISDATQAFDDVRSLGLPLGWKGTEFDRLAAVPSMILGWLFTAIAISLGAPFWFDALNKIMVIRSTIKPTEKSQDEGSKDKPKT